MASLDITHRARILCIFFLIVFVLLLLRLGQLQVVEGEKYRQLSEGNRIDYRPILASRGRIWVDDGQDKVIAVSNKMAYTASLIPANVRGRPLLDVVNQVAAILNLNPDTVMNRISQSSRTQPVHIKRNLSPQELLALEERIGELPGLIIEKTPIRDYVYSDVAAHVLGYVGEISRQELNLYFAQGYRSGDFLGKAGLEKYYEYFLKGDDGLRQIEVNSQGLEVATLGIQPPTQGADLYLTLDISLQKAVEWYLKDQVEGLYMRAQDDPEMLGGPTGGAAVVLEVETGQVLAMASYPSFDLNLFAGGISQENLRLLQQNRFQPFLHRTIQVTPPPGSVFKVMVGTAVLEELNFDPGKTIFSCSGEFQLGSQVWKCWEEDGHGELNFYQALAHSCNVAFYNMGQMLHHIGGESIQRIAREFGFSYMTGIDLPGEKEGLIPDRQWKGEHVMEAWFPGDTINMSIGQGSLQVTPLQLANMINAIANGGVLLQPYIVEKVVCSEGEVLLENYPRVLHKPDISSYALEEIKKAMKDVTAYGTGAGPFWNFPIKVAGKTGTAQTVPGSPSHGWFVGYAPAEDPEIAFVVFIEHGTASRYALPVAEGILRAYFGLEEGRTRIDGEQGDSN